MSIPLRHLAVTGQTQEAGKTTTLEALIERSKLRAVTFITKRGEGSFRKARVIAPYFREEANWQYVASILEASRGEKLKMERAWIIRASKGALTLADVQSNVRKELANPKLRGMSADMYLCLDAYLDQVVPQIATVKWAPTLDLQPGVNAMDLSGISIEMQHLVIRSALTWVLEREKGTVVVIPEAWKFIPQGRGTPVKLAAESYIRQGAGLGNYLWLDSQDLGGIDKAILRSVPVWLLGVQREANEIKRTLDNIPGVPAKPRPSDIAVLKLGEFFACWGEHKVKTYVQPAWMDEGEAKARATGASYEITKGGRREEHSRRPVDRVPPSPTFTPKQEDPQMCEQHQRLERELKTFEGRVDRVQKDVETITAQREEWRRRAEAAEGQAKAAVDLGRALARLLPAGSGGGGGAVVDEDAIVRRVLAQVPAGGGATIQVTPPEALRLQVQKDVAQRIVGEARALPLAAKRLLKVLVALDKRVSQRAAAERAGVAWGGSTIEAYKALADGGLIDSHPKAGTRAAVRDRIAENLNDLGAKDQDIEAVYQNVLYELAGASEAAA